MKTFYMVCNAGRMEAGQTPGFQERQRFATEKEAKAAAIDWARRRTVNGDASEYGAAYVVLRCTAIGTAAPREIPIVWKSARSKQ